MSGIAPHLVALGTIGLVYLAAVASPGPNFFLATQLALSGRRTLGFAAALGIASGSAIWSTLAMVGVAALLAHAAWLQLGIRLFACLYLVWFGIRLIRGALWPRTGTSRPTNLPDSPARAYRAGLLTCLTNPKAAVFWTSIFGAIFPADAPPWMYPATTAVVIVICAGWYVAMAALLSTRPMQRAYDRVRRSYRCASRNDFARLRRAAGTGAVTRGVCLNS